MAGRVFGEVEVDGEIARRQKAEGRRQKAEAKELTNH